MDQTFGRAQWRGIVDVEADRVSLRNDHGAAREVREIFVDKDSIRGIREVVIDIGGGHTNTAWTFTTEDPRDEITDSLVPGLRSLLIFLQQLPHGDQIYNIAETRNYRPFIEEVYPFVLQKRTFHTHSRERHIVVQADEPSPSQPRRGRTGLPGPRGRILMSEDVLTVERLKMRDVHHHPKLFLVEPPETHLHVERPGAKGAQGRRGQDVPSEFILASHTKRFTTVTKTPRTYQHAPMPEPVLSISRTGPRGLRGARGADIPVIEQLVERRVVQINRFPRSFAVSFDEHVSHQRRGQQGSRGDRGRAVYSEASEVQRLLKTVVLQNTPRTFQIPVSPDVLFSPRKPGPKGERGARGFFEIPELVLQRTRTLKPLHFVTTPRSYSIPLQPEPSLVVSKQGPRGLQGARGQAINSVDVVFSNTLKLRTIQHTPRSFSVQPLTLELQGRGQRGLPGPRGPKGRASIDNSETLQIRTKTAVLTKSPKIFNWGVEPPFASFSHKVGPPGKAGRAFYGIMEAAQTIATKLIKNVVTAPARRFLCLFGEAPISLNPRQSVTPHWVSYKVEQPLTDEERERALVTNLKAPEKFVRHDKDQQLGKDDRERALLTNLQAAAHFLRYDSTQILGAIQRRLVALTNLQLPDYFVRYDAPTGLTPSQQLQARRNIGIKETTPNDPDLPDSPIGPDDLARIFLQAVSLSGLGAALAMVLALIALLTFLGYQRNAVLYVPQELDENEKKQARDNIGVPNFANLSPEARAALLQQLFAGLTDAERGLILGSLKMKQKVAIERHDHHTYIRKSVRNTRNLTHIEINQHLTLPRVKC